MVINFFNPAIKLMNKLTYQRKIILLSLIILMALSFLSFSLFDFMSKDIKLSRLELQGVTRLTKREKLVHLLQKHRELSLYFLSMGDDIAIKKEFSKIDNDVKSALDKFISSSKTRSNPQLNTQYELLIQLWQATNKNHGNGSFEQDFIEHTLLIKQLKLVGRLENEQYKLIANNDLAAYYLIENTLHVIPNVIESTEALVSRIIPILSAKNLTSQQKFQLHDLKHNIENTLVEFSFNVRQTSQYLPHLTLKMVKANNQLMQIKYDLFNIIEHDIENLKFEHQPTNVIKQASKDINDIYTLLFSTFIPELKLHIEKKIATNVNSLRIVYAITITLWLLCLYFMIALLLALRSNVRTVIKTINDYQQGNLNAKIELNTDDEMQTISLAINKMTQNLNESNKLQHFQHQALNEHAIVSITDRKGYITYVNKKFEDISKYTFAELIGKNHRIIKSNFHTEAFFENMWQTINSGNVWTGEIKNKAKDGSIYWVSSTIVPRVNDQGKPQQYIAIRTDITHIKNMEIEQQKANKLLQVKKQIIEQNAKRLDTIVDTAMDAAIQINSSGIIIGWNKRAQAIFGWSSNEAIGQLLHTLIIPEKYRAQHIAGVERCLETGDSKLFIKPIEITALNSNGIEFPIEISISLVKYDEHFQFSAFIRDLTQQRKYEQSIIESKEAADKANQAKSKFLSSMSHELRTPLNAILGFGQLLTSDPQTPLSTNQKESVNYILSSGNHLLNLINDILELSAIESGKLELSIEDILITKVISDVTTLMRPIALSTNIKIHIKSDFVLAVMADYMKLKQILINLVSNAIKYNKPNGSITIEWHQTKHDTAKIIISDTGMGIAEGMRSKVFGAFNRLGQETSNIEGTGIGLVVTKELIEMMGGSINFDSILGHGTQFWFDLPLSKDFKEISDKQTKDITKNTMPAQKSKTAKKILYVEDNPANGDLMYAFFERKPHALYVAKTGETGWNRAINENFDLILMDIHLPGIDGRALTQKLRETDNYKNKPIIAITAAAMKHEMQSANGLFDDYITKPVNLDLLDTLLNKHLNERSTDPNC